MCLKGRYRTLLRPCPRDRRQSGLFCEARLGECITRRQGKRDQGGTDIVDRGLGRPRHCYPLTIEEPQLRGSKEIAGSTVSLIKHCRGPNGSSVWPRSLRVPHPCNDTTGPISLCVVDNAEVIRVSGLSATRPYGSDLGKYFKSMGWAFIRFVRGAAQVLV